jgi:hypothetical protein
VISGPRLDRPRAAFGAGELATEVARRRTRARPAAGRWLTYAMVEPIPEPDAVIDPSQPVPDDATELLPDAPEPLPPAPIESTPDDPGGDVGGVPEPA